MRLSFGQRKSNSSSEWISSFCDADRRRRSYSAIDRHDAPPPSVCVPERGKRSNPLGLGVDRLASALRIAAPVRDQSPFQEIQGSFARLRGLPDDEQFLARRGVVAVRHVREPAIPDIEAPPRWRGSEGPE